MDPDNSLGNNGMYGGIGGAHFDADNLAEKRAFHTQYLTALNANSSVGSYCIIPDGAEISTDILRDTYLVEGDFSIGAEEQVTIESGVDFGAAQPDVDLGLGSRLTINSAMDNIQNITGQGSVIFDANISIAGMNLANNPDNNPAHKFTVLVDNDRALTVLGNISLGGGYGLKLEEGAQFLLVNGADVNVGAAGAAASSFKAALHSGDRTYVGSGEGGEAGDWGTMTLTNCDSVYFIRCDVMHGGAGGDPMIAINDCHLSVQTSEFLQSLGDAIRINSWRNSEIRKCTFHDIANGIRIGNGAGTSMKIHNNFIYNTNGNDVDHGIGLISRDQTEDVWIYNNFIFNTGSHGLLLGEQSASDIIYNTVHNPGRHCIFVEGGGSGAEQVYNNVFSLWDAGFRAVAFAQAQQAPADRVDYNIYCDTELQYYEDGQQAGEGLYTQNVRFTNGGPQQVAYQRSEDGGNNPDYNSWGENGQKDDIACVIWSETTPAAEDIDFHLYEGEYWPDNFGGLPCFVNQGKQAEWWTGGEWDDLWERVWEPLPNGAGRRGGRGYWYNEAVSGLPDMGAYCGPWSNTSSWAGTPVEPDLFFLPWNDPFILVDRPIWRWEGNSPVHEYVRLTGDLAIDPGVDLVIPAGLQISVPTGAGIYMNGGTLTINGTYDEMVTIACVEKGQYFNGFSILNGVYAGNVDITYCDVVGASYGLYASGVQSTSDRMDLIDCYFDSCKTAVYSNNSRLYLKNTTITNSHDPSLLGRGIYLTNTTAGQVLIENCDITANGKDATVQSAGVFLSSANPEIVRSRIYGNSGAGVYAYASSPDLNTYDFVGATTRHNDIYGNGTGTQGGGSPNGSEIYLVGLSSPDVRYNNIHEFDLGPNGYSIYMDDFNLVWLNAWQNWWGTSSPNLYESQLFHYGTGSYILYSPWENSAIIDNADDYELAMAYWDQDEFDQAAELFESTAYDTGAIGINSICYLAGCVSQIEDQDFEGLRGFLQNVADDHDDLRVARMARRYATHCLTLEGNYNSALEEYADARDHAESLQDSIQAALDWLAVYELANGNHIDATGDDIPNQMNRLFGLLDREKSDISNTIPTEITLGNAYPNPFNNRVNFQYGLPASSRVRISVHDVQGREVATLINEMKEAGRYSISWSAETIGSGVYFCRLQAGDKISVVKMTLIR